MPIMGRVDGSARRLTVPISVSNGAEPYQVIECEVDTASDVELALSTRDITELSLEPTGGSDFRFNGASYTRPRHLAHVEWHDGPISVIVETTDRPAYVGMGLLWDSYLSGYLFPNGAVTVSRMVHWDDLKREAEEE